MISPKIPNHHTEAYDTLAVVGLMSGTSLDGVDLALVFLTPPSAVAGVWQAQLGPATTVPFPAVWRAALTAAPALVGADLQRLHVAFGQWLGEQVQAFLTSAGARAALVASHGHTIFHQPTPSAAEGVARAPGFTFQLGHGGALAAACGLPVVADFRTLDVALGGQGAPLVPLGDRLLFGQYGLCLNLGGIANLSGETPAGRQAYDVCACNLLLNALAAEVGLPYDGGGALARTGRVVPALLAALDAPAYFGQVAPKSLGREWVEAEQLPLLQKADLPLPDRMRTAVAHIGGQIGRAGRAVLAAAPAGADRRVLATGGGAFHTLLVEEIGQALGEAASVVVPDAALINYKEAIVFALLGALRWRGETNTLASVTGARRDSSGGAIYLP